MSVERRTYLLTYLLTVIGDDFASVATLLEAIFNIEEQSNATMAG